METLYAYPKLRRVEAKQVVHEGRRLLVLKDLLLGDDAALVLPWAARLPLAFCDGRNDLDAIQQACVAAGGPAFERTDLATLVDTLARACLLDGRDAELAVERALGVYRAAPYRPLALAGGVYPADPADASTLLRAFDLRAAGKPLAAARVAGVLSPHIDYARGGLVYAAGWKQAAAAANAAERAIVLGTDHKGGPGRLTLSTAPYATPWGVLPQDEPLRDAVAAALGEERSYAEELHHRSEHSVELAALWLHHARGGRPLTVLPVLCGHYLPWIEHGLPGSDERLSAALEVLRGAVAEGALVVVAGDLAHVGPEFGDRLPFGPAERAAVRAADDALIAACGDGAAGVLDAVGRIDDCYRVCGLSALALALAIMPPVRLAVAAYEQCPADRENASFVSVAAGCFVHAG